MCNAQQIHKSNTDQSKSKSYIHKRGLKMRSSKDDTRKMQKRNKDKHAQKQITKGKKHQRIKCNQNDQENRITYNNLKIDT